MARWVTLFVNGSERRVCVDPATPLLTVLRNDLGLTAAKFGCGLEQCRACTVMVDGEAVPSCVTAVEAFEGREIVTLEGIGAPGKLDPVQEAFLTEGAAQCGYCVAGMIVTLRALLNRDAAPSEAQLVAALEPHLCRCGAHPRMLRAARRAAGGS
jgi:nicotinate dehydrogenase subunit A